MLKAEAKLPVTPLIGAGLAPPEEPAPAVLLQVDAPVVGLPPEAPAVPIPEQRPAFIAPANAAPAPTPALPAPAREEVVSGGQEQLVTGGRQVVQGEVPAEAPAERTDRELIDAFENLLDRLF
jgi:hypothetical protein